MPTDDGSSTAERQWILHSPYAEPSSHWALDEHGRAMQTTALGRRPVRRNSLSLRPAATTPIGRRPIPTSTRAQRLRTVAQVLVGVEVRRFAQPPIYQ